jgi:hypothetical protein
MQHRRAPATIPAVASASSRARRARLLSVSALLACMPIAACGGDGEQQRDATPKKVTIDAARKTGSRAQASAEGIISKPAAVAIRVSAAPKQRVVVSWGLSCPKGDDRKDADKGSGGTYSTTPPNVRALRLPRREIAFCAVRGNARLTRKGRVKVTLLGSKR